ncbi:hypothetical protein SAMN04488504_1343 [Myxococcus virescens]|uniref:Thoeris protein ThsA Macro domain-containing protein n=2 Tax=Myxococcus virescens TaxID=83456 RepID=A0ABY0NEN1_9BACT|nr:hypothetical protein SAMN04488504_1343 [Myxococcus virescens]
MFSWQRAVTAVLAGLGTLYSVVEVSGFFSTAAEAAFKQNWAAFLGAGLLYALWDNWPQTAVSSRLDGRDVVVEIRIGNIFSMQGDMVIGSNTTFETELAPNTISERSIQGQFTTRYYDRHEHMANELQEQLAGMPCVEVTRAGKNVKKYRMGTVAKIRPRNQTAYLIAIADLNDHGNASSSFSVLLECLPALWEHVSTQGGVGPILIPVLGTGFSRLPNQREEIIRNIVGSFVAACASKRFCERLTIVISPSDYRTFGIDLQKLGRFVEHICMYTPFSSPQSVGAGQPVPATRQVA